MTGRSWRTTAWLVLLGALALAPTMFGRELLPPDEPRFALVARGMFESGDMVVLHRAQELYLDKPPLLFWCETLAFHLLGGPGEAAARLPALLATLLLIGVVHRTARRWLGDDRGRDAALVFLSSLLVLERGAWVATDALLAAAVFGAVACLDLAQRSSLRVKMSATTRAATTDVAAGAVSAPGAVPATSALPAPGAATAAAIGAAICAALATLAKGPVALVFLLLAALASRLVARGTFSLGPLVRPWPVAAFVLVAAPWPVLLIRRIGFAPAWGALWRHNAERFAHSWDNLEPWYYHGPQLALGLMPWTLLVFPVFSPTRLRALWADARARWLVTWVGVTLVFFSIPHGKRGVYLLPVYPALAMLIALALPLAWQSAWGRRWAAGVTGLCAVIAGVTALRPPASIRAFPDARVAVAFVLTVIAVLLAWTALCVLRGSPAARWGPVALAVAVGLSFPPLLTPAINAVQGGSRLAAGIPPLIPPGAPVAFTRTKWELVAWYTHLAGRELRSAGRRDEYLAQPGPRVLIGEPDELGDPARWPPGVRRAGEVAVVGTRVWVLVRDAPEASID